MTTWAVPVVGGTLLSRQGPSPVRRTWHNGTDWRAPIGAPVHAVYAGVVESVRRCGYSCSYGNTVAVRHGEDFLSVYAHLSEISVEEGQEVLSGQVIGAVGDTTSLRPNMLPHLHLELVRSWALSPRDYDARRDVLGDLSRNGVVLEGDHLVVGTPTEYDEPRLAQVATKAERDGYEVVVAPHTSLVPPRLLPAWVGGLVVVGLAAIWTAALWPRRRTG